MSIIQTFKKRGFFQQVTHEETLAQKTEQGPVCCYTGFDPTADSLHVGHLIPMMGLAHLQQAGHRVIALVGGGTALIGDPSGKTEMRKILTKEQIESNIVGLKTQLSQFLDFSDGKAELVNNADWLCTLNYIDFLRDIGRHFSVNRMLSFETYKIRMETGLSFLEFNYQLLQAYDFLELYRRHGCLLQLGGDDQWANIISGTDLIRRVEQVEAYGLTYPLLTTSSGKKMGKTEKGAVWLNAERTSPYDYYQYWVNIDDADVEKCLSFFTFLPMDEVHRLGALQGSDIREAKAQLAFEATALVHGKDQAQQAQDTAQALFGKKSNNMENVPTTTISEEKITVGMGLFELFAEVQLCKSKGEARRLFAQGGIYVNEIRISDENWKLTPESLDAGSVLLRAGKKRYHRLAVK
ncbi:MAG: tyrosine--tRNA ligase [SAR324 cluster bacterium]|nr:tyrosine--tRNA ligase [SAR324 cluster bacterium]